MKSESANAFPSKYRLKTPADFKAVYDRKRSASNEILVVYVRENGLPYPRLGLSVSRKVGNAVVRNRFKRMFREAFRLNRTLVPPGIDLVVIPRSGTEPPTLEQAVSSLLALAGEAVRKLGKNAEKPS